MAKTLKISSITNMAMTEEVGLQLRKQIEACLESGEDVCLDFEGIDFFATPFFNSSIGYFVVNLKPEVFEKRISVKNLSELGEETYRHSYQNAISVLEQDADLDVIGRITSDTVKQQ